MLFNDLRAYLGLFLLSNFKAGLLKQFLKTINYIIIRIQFDWNFLALGKEVGKTFNEAKQKIPFKLRALDKLEVSICHLKAEQ